MKFNEKSHIIASLYNSSQNYQLMRILVKAVIKLKVKFKNSRELFEIVKKPIIKYGKTKGSDAKIIAYYKKLGKPVPTYTAESNIESISYQWECIKTHVPKTKVKKLLDFGGNVGDKAHALGEIFNITEKDTYVVDIDEWEGRKWKPRKDITFIHYDNMKKLPKKSIDLIMAAYVLHHISPNEYPKIAKTFDCALSRKGYIILKEHDASVISDELLDLIHLLFDVVISQTMTYKHFCKTYDANYFPIKYWIGVLSKYFVPFRIPKWNKYEGSKVVIFMRK